MDVSGTNHNLKIIKDEIDDSPRCFLLYLESNEKIIASSRLVIYAPHEFPDDKLRYYNLKEHSWIKTYSVCEIERFMTLSEYRGKLTILQFLVSMMNYIVQKNVKIVLQICKSHHVAHFYPIGCRPYTYHLIDNKGMGICIPLIGLLQKSYGKKIKSPVRFIVSDEIVFKPEIIDFFYNAPTPIIFNKDIILKELKEAFSLNYSQNPPLNLTILKQLIDNNSHLLYIDQKIKLIYESLGERTIYFFVTGGGEVGKGKAFHQRISANELVGEFALFMPQGRRTAEVIIDKGTILLVIKESAILKLKHDHPKKYIEFLEFVVRNLINKNIAHVRSDKSKIKL